MWKNQIFLVFFKEKNMELEELIEETMRKESGIIEVIEC